MLTRKTEINQFSFDQNVGWQSTLGKDGDFAESETNSEGQIIGRRSLSEW